MKQIFLIIFTLFQLSVFAQDRGEEILSLNGEWRFKTDPNSKGELLNWFAADMNDEEWDAMSVPGNWDLKNEYSHYVGKAWYRKQITISPAWKSKVVRLLFEAVNNDSKVWLNGKLLGINNLGYLPFEFDISSSLNYNGTNTLVVAVDNTFRRGAIWNWGGIRRPVMAIATQPVYIKNMLITPSVDLKKNTAELTVKLNVENKGGQNSRFQGDVIISSSGGFKRILPFSTDVASNSIQEIIVKTLLDKKDVHLWDFDDPFLYKCQASIKEDKHILHQKTDRFGLRKVEVDNQNYIFKLNGKSIRQMGFNLVPDDRTTGNTLPLWRVKEDIDLLKSLGANMTRLTHLPMHKEMLDYLDEKGLLVFAEIPLWGFDQLVDKDNPLPKQWLNRMITNDYNHPSIIGWSVGNEIGESPGVMEYVNEAIQYVKSLDSTRMAVIVSHTAYKKEDPIQYSDMGLVNGYGTGIGMHADKIHKQHPDKVLFYAEYGYNQARENLDADINARSMMDSIRYKPYLIGGSLWTFNDYRSSYVGTKEFSENRPWGIVDVFRQKKKAFFSFRKEYAPIRDLRVHITKGNKVSTATIHIVPRGVLDLPAYNLKNYILVWKAYDDSGKIYNGGFDILPLIKPGDKEITQNIKWENSVSLSHLKIELVSPLNYSVSDTTIFLKKPAAPPIVYALGARGEMNETRPNTGAIRIILDKASPDVFYKAKYGRDGLTHETAPTRNHFINIPNLAFNEAYQVAVVSLNSSHESDPAEIKKLTVGTGLAPPVIYYTEPADKGFFAGYVTANDDYIFILQYTTVAGDYSNAPTLQSPTKGVLFVPDLINGQRYYFRMKVVKHNNYHTDWSEEHTVVPDGEQMPASPIVEGVLRSSNKAIICFEPVKKAIAYIAQYRHQQSQQWSSVDVNEAQFTHFLLNGLDKNKKYDFRIATINQYGQSEYSRMITQ